MHQRCSKYRIDFSVEIYKIRKNIAKFRREQIVKEKSQVNREPTVIFFVLPENKIHKLGQKYDNSILSRCLKLVIREATKDNLKQMFKHVNNHYRKINNTFAGNSIVQVKPNFISNKSQINLRNSVKNMNLDHGMAKLYKKRWLKALMTGDRRLLSKFFPREQSPKASVDNKVSSKCCITKFPEDLLLLIFAFNTISELNKLKIINKYFHTVISAKRKKLIFSRPMIPSNILKGYLTKSPYLEEIYFKNDAFMKASDILAIEQLNLTKLKVMDLMCFSLSDSAYIRLLQSCRNIETLKINCTSILSESFFCHLCAMKNLKKLTINSDEILSLNDLERARRNLSLLSKHVRYLNLDYLSVYELNK